MKISDTFLLINTRTCKVVKLQEEEVTSIIGSLLDSKVEQPKPEKQIPCVLSSPPDGYLLDGA